MAIKQISNRHYSGNSEDQPETLPAGSIFINIETGLMYLAKTDGTLVTTDVVNEGLVHGQFMTENSFTQVVDGSRQAFTVNTSFFEKQHLHIYKNGLRLTEGLDFNAIPPQALNFAIAPNNEDVFVIDTLRYKNPEDIPAPPEEE